MKQDRGHSRMTKGAKHLFKDIKKPDKTDLIQALIAVSVLWGAHNSHPDAGLWGDVLDILLALGVWISIDWIRHRGLFAREER